MFLFFLIFLTSAFSLPPVGASLGRECLVHKTNFVPSNEGLSALGLPLRIMAANPKLELFNGQGLITDQCSSVVVSDQGHLLTAGHCLDTCLIEQNAYAVESGAHVIDKERLAQVECSVQVNGRQMKAKVLAKNDCLASEFTSRAEPCKGFDYALLELSEKNLFSDCLSVAAANPGPDTNVLVVGYPARTERRQFNANAKDSNGVSQMMSTGRTTAFSPTCQTSIPLGQRDLVNDLPISNRKGSAAFQKFTSDGVLLQATTDLWKGLSGGALVDSHGTLVGIGQNHTSTTAILECKGSAFFTSVQKIAEQLLVNLPPAVHSQVLSCRHHSIR